MATQIYRYRRTAPVTEQRLKDEVGSNTTITGADGGHIVDIQIEDTAEDVDDLDASMEGVGYARIEDNPVTNPEDSFTPEGGGGGGGATSAEYRFSTTTATADPGNQRARFNTGTYSTVTEIYLDDLAQNPTFDMGLIFSTLNPGDKVLVQQNSDATRSGLFTISTITDNGGWWTLVVVYEDDGGGAMITNNAATTFGFSFESAHIRHNLTATVDPVGTDDNTKDYEPGSIWVNTTTDNVFMNTDASTGAAVWPSLTSSGSLPIYMFTALKLRSCLTADWAVNGNAPAIDDSNNSALQVRRFDDTAEEGVGFEVTVPDGATNMQIFTIARAETTPGGSVVAKLLFYEREITDGAAVGSWSSSKALTDVDLGTNEFFVEDETDDTLANWGFAVGQTHQIQVTRTATANTLVGDLALKLLRVEWS